MPIRFRCKCGKIVKVEEQYAGRRAKCPNCGAQLVVPSASTAPEAGGPNAKPRPSTQPAQPPAPELELESESLGPGGKMDDTVEEAKELESEPSGPGGEAGDTVEEVTEGDTVEEVTEVEELGSESEISDVVPAA